MCEMTSTGTLFAIITFIESLVFGFFTMMMLYDQISGVLEEEFRGEQHYKSQMVAYQAAMKTDARYFSDPPIEPPQRSTYELFQDVFGGPFGLSWLNPFTRPESIVDYFQNELVKCVKDADRVTERFVRFADAVQNGEIVLQDQQAQAEEEGGEDYEAELSEGDFEDEDGEGVQQRGQQQQQQQQPAKGGKSNTKSQKVE